MQKARRQTDSLARVAVLRLVVSARFQVLFHSASAVLFTFPSRYWFTIGHQGVFSLGGWSPRIHTEFHVLRATRDPAGPFTLSPTGLSPSMALFSKRFDWRYRSRVAVPQPRRAGARRFGLFPVRSPLLGESRLISLPPGTEMFHFPGLTRNGLCIQPRATGV